MSASHTTSRPQSQPAADAWGDEVPVRIGISSCLLGQQVRYDGGHKRDAFLVDVLGPRVEWVAVCPEVELGLGTPRPPMHLESAAGDVRLVTPSTGIDHTEAMGRYAARRVRQLADDALCGYVFKEGSPSCGLERVRVYSDGAPQTTGRGLFATALVARFPHLPVDDECGLHESQRRESFIERVFTYRRMQAFFTGDWSLAGLVAFHAVHKTQILVHSPAHYETLGRLVAIGDRIARDELRARYVSEFMSALEMPARGDRPRS